MQPDPKFTEVIESLPLEFHGLWIKSGLESGQNTLEHHSGTILLRTRAKEQSHIEA